MFKDFTDFNSQSDLLFRDTPHELVMKAFTQFQALNAALRTEAYDYATWYNKVMRDKYEDGEPVDVTALPYLSVPRSQLAVMRSRIRKTKESCEYAANAITNIAIGSKVGDRTTEQRSTDDATVTVAADRQSILFKLLSITFSHPLFTLGFKEGGDSIVINGFTINISPVIQGGVGIGKYQGGNGMGRFAFHTVTSDSSFSTSFANFFQTPIIIARSEADLRPDSSDKVGVSLASIKFFSKSILVWLESEPTVEFGPYTASNGLNKAAVYNSTIHAKLINPGEEKQTIIDSMYTDPADKAAAAAFDAGTPSFFVYSAQTGTVGVDNSQSTVGSMPYGLIFGTMPSATNNVAKCCAATDFSEATTQTAVKDLFFTDAEWAALEASLSES